MTFQQTFDDGRGRYPDFISAAAPRGLKDRVKRAAEAEHVSLGEFVRQAIELRLVSATATGNAGPHAVR
jgi:hypothetical protein